MTSTAELVRELWRYSNAPVVKQAIARIEALQKVADAAMAVLGPNTVHVGRTHGKSELLDALRALESTDG